MKKLLLIILGLVFYIYTGHAQQYAWLKQTNFQGTGFGGSTQAITKTTNSVAILSAFKDSVRLNNAVLHAPGRSDIYLASYSLQGSLKWATQIRNNYSLNVSGRLTSTSDNQGNIIVAGNFKDSIRIGTNVYVSIRPTFTGFIAKFDSTGTLQWFKPLETSNQIDIAGLATDLNGNVYATGFFVNDIVLANATIATSTTGSNMFLMKYTGGGNLKWIRQGSSPSGGGFGSGVAISNTGDIILTGGTYNSITLGNITLNNSGIYLAKYDSSATIQWAQLFNRASTSKLILDEQDNICLAGTYTDSINFNNQFNLHTTSRGLFLAKANQSGNWIWATSGDASISGDFTGLDTDSANNLYATGWFSGNLHTGNFNITTMGSRNTMILKLDQAGNPKYVHKVGSTGLGFNAGTGIKTDRYGYLYLLGEFIWNGYFGKDSLTSYPSYANGYFVKLSSDVNTVTGDVFLDFNHNLLRDGNESINMEVILKSSPGLNFTNPGPTGEYFFTFGQGNNTVTIPQPPKYYTVTPASYSLNFSGFGHQINNRDFALQPAPNVTDARVTITNLSMARPGALLNYKVTVKNVGTIPLSDTLSVTYDPTLLNFSTSAPVAISQANNLKWFYQNLQPNEKQEFIVTFLVDTAVTLNTNIRTSAFTRPFTADQFLSDNYDTINHVTIASFDPNDKQVNHKWLTPQQIADSTLLDYVIRFQNTGNDTAFTVIVRDSICDNLSIPSFEVLSASHPYTFRLFENGMFEWRFDNILLPDSNRNEPASHGFIRYRMQPKTNLILGDEIKSRAAIYFGYNAPVHTNYAVTKVANPTGIKERNTNIKAFKLYPNPAKNHVMVEANFNKNTTATFSLVNLLGQTLSKVTLPSNNQIYYQLPLNELPKGVYLIRLETESGMQIQRLVIQ